MAFTEKLLTVLPPIEVAGRHVKRYHVTADPAGIAPDVEKAAYEILPELLPEPDGTPPATFVVLHRGNDDGAYLNAYSWVWDNVLHFRGASSGPNCPGSAVSSSCPRSCTSGTPGYGTCSRPKSPTWPPTWPTRCPTEPPETTHEQPARLRIPPRRVGGREPPPHRLPGSGQ